jgi:hypothetical protein
MAIVGHTHAIGEVTGLQAALDAKAATSHTHTASQISDTSAAGRTMMTAVDAAAQRTAMGLGALATAAGVTAAQITDATAAGRAVLTAADAAAQRTALGLGPAALRNIAIGTTAPTAPAVNDIWVDTN